MLAGKSHCGWIKKKAETCPLVPQQQPRYSAAVGAGEGTEGLGLLGASCDLCSVVGGSTLGNSCMFSIYAHLWSLTGFGPGGSGAVLTGGAELSAESSSCLLMSSVVKRLDSSPKIWMIANLLDGLGCKIKKKKKKKSTFLNIYWKSSPFKFSNMMMGLSTWN